MDPSRMTPEMRELCIESFACSDRGDLRGCADLLLKAVLSSAGNPWIYGRYAFLCCFHAFLSERPSIRNESDHKALRKMVDSSKEPALFRANAASLLAVFENGKDRELEMEYLRTVVEIAEQADPSNANRPMTVLTATEGEKNSTVGEQLEELVSTAKFNMTTLMNPIIAAGNTPDYQEEMAKQKALGGFNEEYYVFSLDSIPLELQRRLQVGGNACDCCGKTLEEVGVPKLNCCSVCKMAYYCSTDCQRKQWRAGHKAACREPGDIRPNDFTLVRGLKAKPELK